MGDNYYLPELETDKHVTKSVHTDDLNNAVVVTTDAFDGGDIGAAFNTALDQYPNRRHFKLPPIEDSGSKPVITTTLDLTSNRDFTEGVLDMRGFEATAKTNGEPVIDITGSRFVTMLGGFISGASTDTPSVGVLQARDDSNNNAGSFDSYRTRIDGSFSTAAWYNYAAEVTTWCGCRIRNKDTGNALHITRDNNEGVTSPYATISTGERSTNSFKVDGGQLQCDASNSTHAAAYIRSANNVTIAPRSAISSGKAVIKADAGGGEEITDLKITEGVIGETNYNTDHAIMLDARGANSYYDGIEITNCRLLADSSWLYATSGVSQLQNLSVRSNHVNSGDAADLSNASTLTSQSEFYQPDTSNMTTTTAQLPNTLDSVVAVEDYNAVNINDGTMLLDHNTHTLFHNGSLDLRNNGVIEKVASGSGPTDLALQFQGGAGFYVNGSGEIVAVDEAGNETTIS